jgi:hypothetical protein
MLLEQGDRNLDGSDYGEIGGEFFFLMAMAIRKKTP